MWIKKIIDTKKSKSFILVEDLAQNNFDSKFGNRKY